MEEERSVRGPWVFTGWERRALDGTATERERERKRMYLLVDFYSAEARSANVCETGLKGVYILCISITRSLAPFRPPIIHSFAIQFLPSPRWRVPIIPAYSSY